MTRVKEGAEKWAAQKGIIVTESQMIRELQAKNDNLNKIIDKYARHKHNCKMGEYNTIIRGEGKGCDCGLMQALKGNPNDR